MRKRHGARLAALLTAVLVVGACDDNPFGLDDFEGCNEVRRIQLPATVDGDLTGSDCRLRDDGTPVDYYTFTLNSTQTVTIDMESDEVDSYLILFDEDGFEIDADDDGGFGLDASLVTRLSAGRYVVAANTFEGERGFYRLYVE